MIGRRLRFAWSDSPVLMFHFPVSSGPDEENGPEPDGNSDEQGAGGGLVARVADIETGVE